MSVTQRFIRKTLTFPDTLFRQARISRRLPKTEEIPAREAATTVTATLALTILPITCYVVMVTDLETCSCGIENNWYLNRKEVQSC